MISNWFERLLDTVADHGKDILGLRDNGSDKELPDAQLCTQLVTGQGEATNIALAREMLNRWQTKNDEERLQFLLMLAYDFDPDPEAVAEAVKHYDVKNYDSLKQLMEVTEPIRQELLRRLNMAPNGTAILVDMRAFLLKHLKQYPDLNKLDYDFQHLLSSWFNRGFLRLEQIDWNTSASILEKLIKYEAVHPMTGWDDLQRRLASDRRCYAFFHPALPDDPLIFVEVALTSSMSNAIGPLVDPEAEIIDIGEADTAIFYSINNALIGLRGVSFGNFLIKQVATELHKEFAGLKTFATLSPVPLLRTYIESMDSDILELLLKDQLELLLTHSQQSIVPAAITELISQYDEQDSEITALLENTLCRLTVYYLGNARRQGHAYDPVMHFHLSNGASLERINVFANMRDYGIGQSWGCMVNYRYESSQIVTNHEAYAGQGKITMSSDLQRLFRSLDIDSEHEK
jgi:malonyl-CoA decarboxylase